MFQTGAGWVLVGALVLGLLWAVRRGRAGYASVQSLMAKVEAHASADASAAALASNAVHVDLSGHGSGGPDHYDYQRALNDHDIDRVVAALAVRLGLDRATDGAAIGSGLRPGADGVLARDAVRDQGRQVGQW